MESIIHLAAAKTKTKSLDWEKQEEKGAPGTRGDVWKIILAAVLITLSPVTMARSAGPSPLSLDEAIQLSMQNNPRLKSSDSEHEAAKARVDMAKSGLYPQVAVSETFTRTDNQMWAFGTKLNQGRITTLDFDPAALNDPDEIDNFNTTVSAVLPLFDSGQTWIGISQAGMAEKAQAKVKERIRQEVIAEVILSYSGVLHATQRQKAVMSSLESARARLKLINSLYDAGLVVKSDFLRAKVWEASLERERLASESDIAVARSALNASMGVPMDGVYELTSELAGEAPIQGDLDYWIDKALACRPDLEAARIQSSLADKEVEKTKAAYLPSVYAFGKYEINTEDFDDTSDNRTVGAAVNVDLFEGFYRSSKTREAKANGQSAKSMGHALELGVEFQVRRAYHRAMSARAGIDVAQAAVEQAREGLDIVADRYETGLYTIVNLIDAEASLQEARTACLASRYGYAAARAELLLAAGALDVDFE